MSASAQFRLRESPTFTKQRAALRLQDERKWKKVNNALEHLARDPHHPGLQAHKWDTLKGCGPNREDIWTAYVENHTPGAWRIFFFYPDGEPGVIDLASTERHTK